MTEPAELQSARRHLAEAEASFRSSECLSHLEEALLLLAELASGGRREDRTVARNLAQTYTNKFYGIVRVMIESDRGIPEPDLEHCFKLLLALDHSGVDLPEDARAIKIALARRLVDHYYEGHSPAAKQQALERLTAICEGRSDA